MNVEPSLLNKLTLIRGETIILRHNLVETELGFKKSHHSRSLSSVKCSENPSSQIRESLIYICNMKIEKVQLLDIYTPRSSTFED